ncbi:hypothetical protein BSL78_08248 [Apostichopus japonicus]|uniref:Uncharacterized protein n=1 Tax=Stichopus japonicus TaxID=307972 RepID=A0A2G8L3H8_STIJA|nr:hypothetical protein BSL78_08248 [Apostichopus japonicus]
MHVTVFDKRYTEHVILFLLQTLKVCKEKVDALFWELKCDMNHIRDIIDEWHKVYGSTSEEDEKANREHFDKLVGILMERIHKAKTGSKQMRSNPEFQGADNEKESGNQTSPTSSDNNLRLFSARVRDAFFEFQLEDPSNV